MTVEHWIDDDSTSVFSRDNAHTKALLSPQAVKCCEIEGNSWEDCMAKYHEHMGWEPYVPMPNTPLVGVTE